MLHTNRFSRPVLGFLLSAACLKLVGFSCLAAEDVKLREGLSTDEAQCLRELLWARPFDHPSASEIEQFITETAVGNADLRDDGRRQFIFLVHDIGYCGSAGCTMLIGQREQDGQCRLIAEISGDGDAITVLNHRDHGYRRLYTPCEFYFDSQQYQLVREECPNANVHR